MDRRTYLTGLLAALTGCATQDSRRTPTPTPSDSPTPISTASPTPTGEATAPTKTPPGTATPVESGRVTLESNDPYRTAEGWVVHLTIFRVRRGIIEAGDPHDSVLVPADRQFLQIGVETRGDGAPAPDELCLAATVEDDRPFDGCTAHLEAVPPRKLGFLQAVPVPLSFAGERATVAWDRSDAQTVRWRVPDQTLRVLRRPPEFVVENVSEPATAHEGDTIEVEITVRNTGDRKDWFVAELGLASASDGMNLEIPYDAGTRRTVPRDLTAHFGDADELVVRLDWGRDAIEKRVRKA